MTIQVGEVTLVGIVSLLLGIFNVLAFFWFIAVRWTEVSFKTSELWKKISAIETYLIRSALVEARNTGAMQQNSPLRLNPDLTARFKTDLGNRLLAFYHKNGLSRVKDSEAILLLDAKFGPELVEQIAIPLGMSWGATLVAALQYVKETPRDAGSSQTA